MAAKILKYAALPAAVVGLGSFRIYSTSEKQNEELISPRELSIYPPGAPALQFVEKTGLLQTGLESVRLGLQPYVKAVQNGIMSVKVGIISAYQAGEDAYHFLRDPPPGFLPRVGVITVTGLGGLVLARKGSRLKRIVVPVGLATLGTAVCYPTQTVAVLKISGKKVYNVSSSVASMFESKPEQEAGMPAVSVKSAAPATISDPVLLAPELLAPESELTSEVTSRSEVESMVETAPEATSADFVVDTSPDSTHEPTPSTETDPAAGLLSGVTVPVPVLEATPPSVEVPPSAESPVEEVIVEPAKAKSRFVPDPALLDHGQANPEDADMYSTRS